VTELAHVTVGRKANADKAADGETIDGETVITETIDSTTNHPYFVVGYGYVDAGNLIKGDVVLLANGEEAKVEKVEIEFLTEPVTVYNFEVKDWHCYFVGEAGVLVHNGSCANTSGAGNTGGRTNGNSGEGGSNRFDRVGYQSGGRSNNLFGRDRQTRNTVQNTEWRRSISKNDIHDEMRLFLGDDYVKVDAGKWRSLDGTRQFRTKPIDYLGKHPIGQPSVPNTPHVHFEFLSPRNNGNGFDIIKNVHVPLVD